MPYSGFYANLANCQVIQYHEPASLIPVPLVTATVDQFILGRSLGVPSKCGQTLFLKT
jgi:hypothetical protein